MDTYTAPRPNPNLRQRNSIALVPTKLTLPNKLQPPHHASSFLSIAAATASTSTSTTSSSSPNSSAQSFSTIDFELIKRSSSYTSLKDLLPSTAAVQSPTASGSAVSGYEISIRNRLVKQAAWAYLQPMSTSPDSVSGNLFHHLWIKFSGTIFRFFDQLLRAVRVRSSR